MSRLDMAWSLSVSRPGLVLVLVRADGGRVNKSRRDDKELSEQRRVSGRWRCEPGSELTSTHPNCYTGCLVSSARVQAVRWFSSRGDSRLESRDLESMTGGAATWHPTIAASGQSKPCIGLLQLDRNIGPLCLGGRVKVRVDAVRRFAPHLTLDSRP